MTVWRILSFLILLTPVLTPDSGANLLAVSAQGSHVGVGLPVPPGRASRGGLAVCPECGGPDLALPGADVDGGVRHCVHMLAEPGGRDPVPGGPDLHHRGGSFGVCLHGSHRGAAHPPL